MISSINQARLKGFTEFTFYPTLEAANLASYERCCHDEKLRTVVFDEVVSVGGLEFVLHVLGTTPRPKSGVKLVEIDSWLPPTPHSDEWKANAIKLACRALTDVGILEYLAGDCDCTDEGARMLVHAAWHLENPAPRHNDKLNAFAWFMGEWAAKLRKVVSR